MKMVERSDSMNQPSSSAAKKKRRKRFTNATRRKLRKEAEAKRAGKLPGAHQTAVESAIQLSSKDTEGTTQHGLRSASIDKEPQLSIPTLVADPEISASSGKKKRRKRFTDATCRKLRKEAEAKRAGKQLEAHQTAVESAIQLSSKDTEGTTQHDLRSASTDKEPQLSIPTLVADPEISASSGKKKRRKRFSDSVRRKRLKEAKVKNARKNLK